MDKQNPSAPPCAQPRIPRGITHINVRHTTRFTVIGNHLAQHPELSGLAIGLAVHIQSLPTGARGPGNPGSRTPPPPPELRRLRPRLPGPGPRPLPRLPIRSPGGRLA